MTTAIRPERLREVRDLDDVLEFLAEELDWPIEADDLEEATFEYSPEELGIPLEQVPKLTAVRQLRPLTASQPWGIFFLEFQGPRLPVTPLRRLLRSLVTKKRSAAGREHRTWDLSDLLFIITTDSGDTVELHFLAFFDAGDTLAEIRSLPWRPDHSPAQHLARLARELLPRLTWPDAEDADSWRTTWRDAFRLRHGEAISSASRLAERMASAALHLRSEIAKAVELEHGSGPFSSLLSEVREQLVSGVDTDQFADMCAQTLVYGVLTSRVSDPVAFGATPTLTAVPLSNPFLSAFFDDVNDHASTLDLEDVGLEQLVADLRVTNVEAILDQFGAGSRGGDPVIHFYEEFLERYDRGMRAEAGAFYTPQPVVEFMTRTVDRLLKSRFGLSEGLADATPWSEVAARSGFEVPIGVDPRRPFVSMIDPATGTGTFLVEWLKRARASFLEDSDRGSWPRRAAEVVLPSLHAFELMLGPYAIAHLKVALELHGEGVPDTPPSIVLTDTLERATTHQTLFDDDPISKEGERAEALKADARFTVCIGNPPYLRADRGSTGGWVVRGDGAGPSLFEDVLAPARDNTAFGHLRSLSNLYVYFWRWALWKTLEADSGPGVIAFITASSWLSGPGFMGLRKLVRELGDEVIIVDLGGDSRGARPEENVFDIQTPVAIVFVVRTGAAAPATAAVVSYTRVSGSRTRKLEALAELDVVGGQVETLPRSGWLDPMLPATGDARWESLPALFDLIPWQQPGCLASRTWPIATTAPTLEERWRAFVSITDLDDRADAFRTAKTGRNIYTRVPGMERLADLSARAPHQPIVRYGYRSFDRQWILEDPRLLKTEAPTLWAARSDRQIFMTTLATGALGSGPGANITTDVPDYHYFCGRGGRDVLPLYRDSTGTPNAHQELLDRLGQLLGCEAPSPEHLFAYCYFVLAGTDFTDRFSEELQTPGPRIPMTRDSSLFAEATRTGGSLIWLHSYGERWPEHAMADGLILPGVQVHGELSLPDRPSDLRYDLASQTLTIGEGSVSGVSEDVWEFGVSGMPVLKKWLSYRTRSGAGRSAGSDSPLDQIRPRQWADEWTQELLELISVLQRTVVLRPAGATLLQQILDGPLVAADELPEPPAELRRPPAVANSRSQAGLRL